MNSKAKVLVVEDETPLAMLIVHLLTAAGCDVCAAHTGRRAMELAAQTKFDLIVLEAHLPDVDGLMVCGELKQRHISRLTPVVFTSHCVTEEDRQKCLEVGAADFIVRPFEADDFIFRVESLFKNNKTNQKRESKIEKVTA